MLLTRHIVSVCRPFC